VFASNSADDEIVEKKKSGQWGPYRQASPHKPGTASALGLRADRAVVILAQTASEMELVMFTRLLQRPGTRDHYTAARRNRNRSPIRRLSLQSLEDRSLMSGNVVLDWNTVALAATVQAGNAPPVAARTMAIVQAAVYDAVNTIDQTHEPYASAREGPSDASPEAAAAAAAHRVLIELYPNQSATFDTALVTSLAAVPDGSAENKGVALGQSVALHLLDLRANDGANATVTYTPGNDPGDWQLTPPLNRPPLVPHWGSVTPFTMTSGDQFRPAGPPALTSADYTAAFNEVKELGSANSTTRTTEETEIAKFWADSSVPHWNKIAATVSEDQGLSLPETARLFAMMNLATADAYISSFEAKYVYNFWRPITAIRAADTDGNSDTLADPSWSPLIVNPQMPAYASGHSTFGGAAAVVLAGFFGTDDIAFSSTSDFMGMAGVTRSFDSFSEAAEENARSRMLAGIHWSFDNDDGLLAGRALGEYVVDNFLTPEGADALMAADSPVRTVHKSLSANQVQPLLTQALSRWQAAGVDTSALTGLDVRIADLGGLTLGRAEDGVIWLDDNAAGWGWFVDRTPRSDSEFTRRGNQGERNRIDLLSVLTHEVGHVLGAEHAAGGVMQETLDAGVRRTVGSITTTIDSPGASPTLFVWNLDSMGLGDLANPFAEKE
jgi:hypothetical protein